MLTTLRHGMGGMGKLQHRARSRTTRSQWPSSYSQAIQDWLGRARAEIPENGAAQDLGLRRLPIRLVSSIDQCKTVTDRVLQSPCVALDCKGARLGRFGKLSTLQLATDREVFIVDVEACGREILEPLQALLLHTGIVKVLHDCRELSSVLANQYSTPLHGVYDTQIAFAAWLERQGLDAYQAGLSEVLRTFHLNAFQLHRWDRLERNSIPPMQWHERPLCSSLLRHAVESVVHLLPLQRALNRELGDPAGTLIQRRSIHNVDYAKMNSSHLPLEGVSSLRAGVKLQAMLASRKPEVAYFKLNHAPITGAVVDVDDLKEFADMQVGDIVDCEVKALSPCQQFVYLLREGHGSLMFDRQRLKMVNLAPTSKLDEMRPSRQSSLYGHGSSPSSGGPSLKLEPRSFREMKPTVVHKPGKRGSVKVKKTGFKPPAPQHQSFE